MNMLTQKNRDRLLYAVLVYTCNDNWIDNIRRTTLAGLILGYFFYGVTWLPIVWELS